MTSIIIADITTLKWRGLVSGLTSAPFLVNAVIGSKLATAVLENLGWRWGCKKFICSARLEDAQSFTADGMFAIVVPVAMAPLILTLFWGERQAKKQGLVAASSPHESLVHRRKGKWAQRAWHFAEQLDLVGLVLLGVAVALILLPMTLAQRAKDSWSNRECIYIYISRFRD